MGLAYGSSVISVVDFDVLRFRQVGWLSVSNFWAFYLFSVGTIWLGCLGLSL